MALERDLGNRVTETTLTMFTYLLKLHLAPGSTERVDWIEQCLHFQAEAVQHFDSSMRQEIGVEMAWRRTNIRSCSVATFREPEMSDQRSESDLTQL